MLVQKFTLLPHCWVCGLPFGPSVKKEDHHVIPQAYGGTDGPQVSLCDSHHTALHHIALRLWSKKPFHDLLTGDIAKDKKLMYLATCVHNARLATEKDPNKRRVIVLTPSRSMLEKLDKLKTVYGRTSRETLIEKAISDLYSKHFIN